MKLHIQYLAWHDNGEASDGVVVSKENAPLDSEVASCTAAATEVTTVTSN